MAGRWRSQQWSQLSSSFSDCGCALGPLPTFRVAEFRDNARIWRAFRHALRHMIALAVWAVMFAGAAVWVLFCLRRYTPQFGVWFRQKLNAGILALPTPQHVFRD